ncbi:MAG: hypothetical protein GXX83_03880 [Gaiellales bacterium]|nr:hypothetical protein [Gaiellales bacterium]
MEWVSGVGGAGRGARGCEPRAAAGGRGEILPDGIARWWGEHRGRAPFFLVPSREDATELTLALASRDGPLLGAAVAGTFDDLASLLLGGRVRPLGEVAREAVVRWAAAPTLAAPDGVLGRLGSFPAGLAGLLEEMEASGLGGEQIGRVLAAWEALAPESDVRRLAQELRVIYQRYAMLCADRSWHGTASTLRAAALRAQGAVEAEEPEREVASIHAAAPLIHAPGPAVWARPILCVGFLTFTPVQRLLLDALSRRTTVTLEPSWTGSPNGGQAPVRLLQSAGRRGEMETVAAEVVELMRAGMEAADIALVARSAGPWRKVAKEVFSVYGIPLRVDASFRFRETGLGSALLSAVGAMLRGETRALIGWFRGRYSQAHPQALRGRELERWRGIVSWPADPAARGVLAELFPQDMALLQGCVETDGGGAPRLRPAGVVDLARSMVAVSVCRLPLMHPMVAEDARALQALESGLAEVEETDGGGMDSAGGGAAWTGAAALLDILADAALWPAPHVAGGVTLQSAGRLRLRPYRAVFVLGLVDQEFPAGDQSSGLLPTSLRRECNRLGGEALFEEPAEDLDARLFQLAVSHGAECVYLSQRVSDDNGNALSPSPFLLSVDAEGGGLSPWRQRTLADVVHPVPLAPSHHEFLRSCAAGNLLPEGEKNISRLVAAARSLHSPACLGDARVIEVLSSRSTFAAGEIEAYARCPFAWFLQSQVGLRAAEEDAGPQDLGLLVHAVMARLYTELGKLELLPLTQASSAAALDCAERVLSEVAAGRAAVASPASRGLLLAQARYRVREHLEREAAAGGAMMTCAVELSLPAQGVELGDGLAVRGRVDRVDVSPSGDGFAVMDYKTGSYVPRKAWAEEGMLQVALYLLALSVLWPQRRPLGGGYLFLGRGQGKGLFVEASAPLAGEGAPWVAVPEEELRRQLEDCRLAALGVAEGIRSGRVGADLASTCPRYCVFGPVCRSRRGSPWGWS